MSGAGILLALAVLTLADPAQESRAQALEREIRCVVCENEPISQSSADIALDMRRLIRARIEAGDSDAEIRAYFAARYGDFVLLRPPVSPATIALWASPVLLAALGLLAVFRLRRSGQGAQLELEPIEDDR